MNSISKIYKRDNYTIQKSINLENRLYTRLKDIVDKEYDTTISGMVNVCIEDLISEKNIKYYARPQGEMLIYKSIMIRKSNLDELYKINNETGIAITRLINIAIKNFLDEHDRK